MHSDSGAIARAIHRLTLWLTPVRPAGDALGEHEQRLLIFIGLITLPFALLYVIVSYAIAFRIGVVLMLTCLACLLAMLRCFQVSGRFRLCANLYLAICFFVAILGCSFFSGGIHSMVTPWFTLAPLASVLLLELSIDTIVWTLLTGAVILIYGWAEIVGLRLPVRYDTHWTAFFNTTCIIGLTMILSWIAFTFGRHRSQALATISAQQASLQRALDEIENLAYYDVLTQLPNRRLFMDRLGQALAKSKRSGAHAALLFLDLDNFKSLNDTRGHEAGDLLLNQVAQRLTSCVRESDTLARFGGDEFAVILDTLSAVAADARAQAGAVAEKIAVALAEPYVLNPPGAATGNPGVIHRCSASIGVVLFRDYESASENLVARADEAMYRAKSAGKNAIYFHANENP